MSNRKPIELDPGHGILWQKESDNPKAPAYSGVIEIPSNLTGRAEIALWRYTSAAGKPYLKVIVQPPYKRTGDPGARGQERRSRDDDARSYRDRDRTSERAPQRRQDPPPDEGFDDEIPF